MSKQLQYRKGINTLENEKFSRDGAVRVTPDGVAADILGRTRTVYPHSVFESKLVDGEDPTVWDVKTNGAGSSAVYDINTSSMLLTAGPNIGDYVQRTTRMFMPYEPGRPQQFIMTAVLKAPVPGQTKRFGPYCDYNGIYLQQLGDGTYHIGIRSNTSGAVVDTLIPQTEWSEDTLDGSFKVREEVALTKLINVTFEYLWLGTGPVNVSLMVEGKLLHTHTQKFENLVDNVYMRIPNLPARYEVINESGVTSASMSQICTAVLSEGGHMPAGAEFSASNKTSLRSVSAKTPVLAVRLAQTVNGQDNRFMAKIAELQVLCTTNSVVMSLEKVQDPTTVIGTWAPVGPDSVMEYSTDVTLVSGEAHRQVVMEPYAVPGVGSAPGLLSKGEQHNTKNHVLTRSADNSNADYFVVYADAVGLPANVGASLSWVEIH